VDAYFSATKIKWLLENNIKVKKLLEKDNLCIGTIDSYITYKLTNGEKFITDTSNASRTMLFNINTLCWDKKLLKIFNIPENILPEVISNGKEIGIAHTKFGDIKIGAILGDQQASLFGQGCFVKGLAKATYGTGCFILSNTGYKPLYNKKMLSTIAWTINNETTYALEGSIFNAGTVVNFMIDNLNLIESNNHSSDVAKSIKNTNGLYFVPAFTGMGAPYWNSYATGSLIGLTRGTEKSHIIRAGLESMAYNTLDIINCMEKEEEINIHELRVDGGVSRNEFLMQFQADMLNKKVSKSESSECTVLGVIYLTGLSLGFYKDITEIKKLIKQSKIYINKMNEKTRKELYQGWQNAVKRTIGDIK
jgi:glycerol kinase